MIRMRILKEFGAYCPGETASFLERDAINLEKKGLAVRTPEARCISLNPKSEDLAAAKLDAQMKVNDEAAARVARLTGTASQPSANGYDVAAEKPPKEK